jgi:hypothetical protein
MAGTSPTGRRLAFALIALSLGLWVALRLNLGIGWGAIDRLDGAEQIPLGIAHGIEDNLSYVAWAEQARDGLIPFSILQTTEPHSAVFVAPVFVAFGWIAALLGVHPLLVMNLAALGAGALALYFVFRTGLAMGLSGRAALLGMLFTAYGSGLSAVALALSHRASWAQGTDARYLDLMPSAILPYFPYQCLGMAAVMALVWALLWAEARLIRDASTWLALVVVFALALLAIAVRPYAPTALLASYAGLVALTWLCRGAPGRRRARLLLLLALTAGIGPLALYYHWVASQPVWAEFAAVSLEIPYTRLQWLIGFGLFWPFAAFGAFIALKEQRRSCDLVCLWAGFVLLVLVIINAEQSKLADDSFIALALLTAHAVDRAVARLAGLARCWRLPGLVGLGLCLIAVILSTLVLYGRGRGPDYYPIDREILIAAKQIRTTQPRGIPTVLTEYAAGALLPPLASLRVYAGHWSLTVDPVRKVKQLVAAGFEATSPAGGSDAGRRNAYAQILAETEFDWVLVRKDRPVVPLLKSDPRLRATYRGERWLLFHRVQS